MIKSLWTFPGAEVGTSPLAILLVSSLDQLSTKNLKVHLLFSSDLLHTSKELLRSSCFHFTKNICHFCAPTFLPVLCSITFIGDVVILVVSFLFIFYGTKPNFWEVLYSRNFSPTANHQPTFLSHDGIDKQFLDLCTTFFVRLLDLFSC